MYATGRQVRDERGVLLGWADLGKAPTAVVLRLAPTEFEYVSSDSHTVFYEPEFEQICIFSQLFFDHGLMRRVWVVPGSVRGLAQSLSCFVLAKAAS